jgi:hypothetical protein
MKTAFFQIVIAACLLVLSACSSSSSSVVMGGGDGGGSSRGEPHLVNVGGRPHEIVGPYQGFIPIGCHRVMYRGRPMLVRLWNGPVPGQHIAGGGGYNSGRHHMSQGGGYYPQNGYGGRYPRSQRGWAPLRPAPNPQRDRVLMNPQNMDEMIYGLTFGRN